MPRTSPDDEEWQGDESSWDADDREEDSAVDDDEQPTVPCPYCRKQIHEDAPRCPYCERYVSDEDAPPPRKPWWLIVGAALGLYAAFQWII